MQESIENIRRVAHDVLDGLPPEALVWRPDADANTIAWLVWHLVRVQDDHVSELAGRGQVWEGSDWASRFGLAAGTMRLGYGDTTDEVAQVVPADGTALGQYLDAVTERTLEYLTEEGDWERIVDTRWDPPVTAAVRLASVIADDLQHAGQAAYVRGMWERS